MVRKSWKKWLPPRPTLPPRLGLAAAGTGLAGASVLWREELWPRHPGAVAWSWAIIVLGVLAGSVQVLRVLWAWPDAGRYAGPTAGWLLWRGFAFIVIVGMIMFLLGLAVLALLLVYGGGAVSGGASPAGRLVAAR